jgi:ubiquinone/menaquinone biosynthesis C-methylase UbiE
MKLCPVCSSQLLTALWRCARCGHDAPREDGFPLLAPALRHHAEGFDPKLFASFNAVEAASFWFRARNRLVVWLLARYVPAPNHYLEIGCGTGFVLSAVQQAFPRSRLTGSEVLVEGLSLARRRVPTAELVQMDARRIPFASEFDAIGAFDVLEHIDDDQRVLHEVHRALRPGGAVILSVPQHPGLWSAHDEAVHHVRRYRVGELRQKVERAGLRVTFDSSFVSLLLPLMWLSRRRIAGGTGDPGLQCLQRDLTLPSAIDRLLGAVLAIELGLIRLGVRLPFGGSRFVLAYKDGPAA